MENLHGNFPSKICPSSASHDRYPPCFSVSLSETVRGQAPCRSVWPAPRTQREGSTALSRSQPRRGAPPRRAPPWPGALALRAWAR